MWRVAAVLLILLGLGWLASRIPAAPRTPPPTTVWRRTCDGWQRADWLNGEVSRRPPAFHPALLALVLVLFAVAALLGLAPEDRPAERRRKSGNKSLALGDGAGSQRT
jgi:hypothetical protein